MTHASDDPGSRPRQILAFLEEAEGWCSGEAISRRLGISRAAVGKHVAALRREGHAVAAATRRGYRLLAKCDRLDGSALSRDMPTQVLGKQGWTVCATTTSTNHEAVRLALEGTPEGHVILAEHQTRGRGRQGHDWFSAPRGLQFSVILRPGRQQGDAEALTRLGVLAAAEGVRELTGLDPEPKPPNDVLLRGRKVVGVLVETGFRGGEPEWAVLGIGCNVNALPEDFPENLRPVATSLLAESGAPQDRAALLGAMLVHLERGYTRLLRGELDAAALSAQIFR